MRPKRSLRAMLDTNAFDRLASDPEAVAELSERRDLRLYVSEVQLAELSAVPDADKRQRLLDLARSLCVRVSAATVNSADADVARPPAGKHVADALIAAASFARCDLLVSDDEGLVRYARELGLRAMGWDRFASAYVFVR